MIHRFVKVVTQMEVSEREGERIHALFKHSSKRESKEGRREGIHWLIETLTK